MLNLKISQLTLSINQEIATLRSGMAAINTCPSRDPDSKPSTYRSRSRSRSRTFHGADGLCWYHWRYGSQSRKCKEPCTYNSGNGTGHHWWRPVSLVRFRAVYSSLIELLKFNFSSSKSQRVKSNYVLSAANGTTINTYGTIICLNFGLCQDFTWRFVIAEVSKPIIAQWSK